MSDTYFLIFGIILAILGAIILFTAVKNALTCKKKIYATISSIATQKTTLRGSTIYYYHPVVAYDAGGNHYETQAPFSTGRKDKYIIGNKMVVYIDESNPGSCRFPGKPGLWITGLLFLFAGLFFAILYFV